MQENSVYAFNVQQARETQVSGKMELTKKYLSNKLAGRPETFYLEWSSVKQTGVFEKPLCICKVFS